MTNETVNLHGGGGSPTPTDASVTSSVALYALAFAAFALGSTEFVVVGLLPEISSDLDVSVHTAGLLVSLYALTIAISTPFLAAATSHISVRKLFFGLLTVFSICNIAAAAAPNYAVLGIARIVMALTHGAFFGVAMTVATSLVDKSKAGRAVSTVMGGVMIAMVVGVPAGALIGQLINWRAPFLIIGVMGLVSLGILAFALPKSVGGEQTTSALNQLAQLAKPGLARLYLAAVLSIGATLVFFTYLSPFLTEITGVSESTVATALMLFGIACVVGNLAGGRLLDAVNWKLAMTIELLGLAAALLLAFIDPHSQPAVMIAVVILGFCGFAIPSVLQTAVVAVAKVEAPTAVGTASGMTVASINLGICGGSFLGGLLIDGPGLIATPAVGIVLAALALILVWLPIGKSE